MSKNTKKKVISEKKKKSIDRRKAATIAETEVSEALQ